MPDDDAVPFADIARDFLPSIAVVGGLDVDPAYLSTALFVARRLWDRFLLCC